MLDKRLRKMVQDHMLERQRQLMTLPDERYRALKWAEQFMQDLMDPSKTPRVPKSIRTQARSVLRHYPSSYHLDQIAAARPDIIAADMEAVHRFILQGQQDAAASGTDQERDPSL